MPNSSYLMVDGYMSVIINIITIINIINIITIITIIIIIITTR